MEGSNRVTATRSGMGSKPSKASLTSVSPCRKNPDKSVSKRILRQTQLCYRMSDVVISLVVIFPLVIGFWRGVWNLMEYYSKLYDMDPWLCIGIGYTVPFLLYWLQEPLKKHIRPRKMNYVLFYIITRYLLLLHSFGSVNQWRGIWALLDLYTGIGFYSAMGSLVVGVVLSIFLKTFCNVLAPPVYLAVDEAYAIHDCPLRFHTKPQFKLWYFVDCIVSVFVAATLIVCSWRGLWELADLYLYPEEALLSAIASLIFGYMLVLLLFICQPYIHKSMEKLEGVSRLMVANLVTFVGFLGCVFAWRGLWMIYDELLGTPNASDWITTLIGAIGSLILGCISTIIVRGVAVDGEVSDDGTSEWPIPYVSLLRDSIYDVPFPEPWLFRYLCTSQKMNYQPTKKKQKDSKTSKEKSNEDGPSIPLNQISNLNLQASSTDEVAYSSSLRTASILKVNLNSPTINLRNIDSSCSDSESEEDRDEEASSIVSKSNLYSNGNAKIVIRQETEKGNNNGNGNKVSETRSQNGTPQVKIKHAGSSESFELKPLRKINNEDVENANSNVSVSSIDKGICQVKGLGQSAGFSGSLDFAFEGPNPPNSSSSKNYNQKTSTSPST